MIILLGVYACIVTIFFIYTVFLLKKETLRSRELAAQLAEARRVSDDGNKRKNATERWTLEELIQRYYDLFAGSSEDDFLTFRRQGMFKEDSEQMPKDVNIVLREQNKELVRLMASVGLLVARLYGRRK